MSGRSWMVSNYLKSARINNFAFHVTRNKLTVLLFNTVRNDIHNTGAPSPGVVMAVNNTKRPHPDLPRQDSSVAKVSC